MFWIFLHNDQAQTARAGTEPQVTNADDARDRLERLVMNILPSEINELKNLANLLDEAANNLRELMGTQKAVELQVRVWLPDELEGSAIMLRDFVSRR